MRRTDTPWMGRRLGIGAMLARAMEKQARGKSVHRGWRKVRTISSRSLHSRFMRGWELRGYRHDTSH